MRRIQKDFKINEENISKPDMYLVAILFNIYLEVDNKCEKFW